MLLPKRLLLSSLVAALSRSRGGAWCLALDLEDQRIYPGFPSFHAYADNSYRFDRVSCQLSLRQCYAILSWELTRQHTWPCGPTALLVASWWAFRHPHPAMEHHGQLFAQLDHHPGDSVPDRRSTELRAYKPNGIASKSVFTSYNAMESR
jgi:hypothetical protein